MGDIAGDLTIGESLSVSAVASAFDLRREEVLLAVTRARALFEANRPLRRAVSDRVANGIPFTDKEALSAMLKLLGGYVGITAIGSSTVLGTALAGALGLSAGFAALLSVAVFLLFAFAIFYAASALWEIVSGLLDGIRQKAMMI